MVSLDLGKPVAYLTSILPRRYVLETENPVGSPLAGLGVGAIILLGWRRVQGNGKRGHHP
jgi:hypothetical protein